MKKKLIRRAIRKLYRASTHHFFSIFLRKDYSTGILINKRNDMHAFGSKNASWTVPVDLLSKNSICYCVGCGEDISFDLALIKHFGCNVYAFDPTERSIKFVKETTNNNEKYHFFDVGLWDKETTLKFFSPKKKSNISHSLVNLQKTDDYVHVKVKRLKQIMEELGHKKIDLLKIDIEGAEYKVLETILEDKIEIEVLCVEYDELFGSHLDEHFKSRICDSINKLLTVGYKLVLSEGNGNFTFVKDQARTTKQQ